MKKTGKLAMKEVLKKAAKKEVKKKQDQKRKCKKAGRKMMETKLLRAGQPIPGKTPPCAAAAM